MGRDARLEVRTLDKRRHKTQGEAVPEKLGDLGSQVKGEPEAQWLGVPEQVMQPSKSRFRERKNWWWDSIPVYTWCICTVKWMLIWTGFHLLLCPFGTGSAPGVHRVAFSLIWKEQPGLCTVGLLQADESALTRVVGRFAAKALSLSGLKY